jgi:cyclic-di-AMP phosphodiesterase PgpH
MNHHDRQHHQPNETPSVQPLLIESEHGRVRSTRPLVLTVTDLVWQTVQQSWCFWKAPRASTLWVVAIVSLTGTVGHRFYNEPKLDVGTIAPETIRAPESAKIEDRPSTEEKRRLARTISGPIFVLDPLTNQQIQTQLQLLLNQIGRVRQLAGEFPFVAPTVLSLPSQQALRQSTPEEWDTLQQAIKAAAPRRSAPEYALLTDPQWQAIVELRNYSASKAGLSWVSLRQEIIAAQRRYLLAQQALTDPDQVKVALDPAVLDLTAQEWQQAQSGLQLASQRMLAQGIFPGLAPHLLQLAAGKNLEGTVPKSSQGWATQLLAATLRPNVVKDSALTQQRALEAAQAVEPVVVAIRRKETIVRAGERINPADFVLLDHFGLSRRGFNWLGLVGCGVLVTGAMIVVLKVAKWSNHPLSKRDQLLILLLSVSAPLLATFGVPYTSLPMIGLLVGSFYGSRLALTIVLLLAGIMPIGLDLSVRFLVSGAVGGVLGGIMAPRLRSREELALLGGGVGLTQTGTYLLMHLVLEGSNSWFWYAIFALAAVHGLSGLAWCIVALGLSPYLEHLFDLATPIRLAELSNPNRSLLKRLATETPGTFQHTLFVATLAEAAARVLGCNVELVRAGTLYHDIGKMHDPQGFIENQMSGINKHDLIANPWESATIIKKHVTEGLVMARKHRLPRAIQAFIPEHQGTMRIAYFYHQAEEQAKTNPNLSLTEADFRYQGPIPQSRETGIVMLADSCEAALRSLKEATPEIALSMVNKILKARWQDEQLIESGLRREEMPIIAEIFVEVWQQHNHQRIVYPKAALSPAKV